MRRMILLLCFTGEIIGVQHSGALSRGVSWEVGRSKLYRTTKSIQSNANSSFKKARLEKTKLCVITKFSYLKSHFLTAKYFEEKTRKF